MATRPVFIPSNSRSTLVQEVQVNFEWHSGFSIVQKQKNIRALHFQASILGYTPILEISTKSENILGRSLSAFNMKIEVDGTLSNVENFYQSSKVFENGGPFVDLLSSSPIEAKRDERLRNSGRLTHFYLSGRIWELIPRTAFYDWLYLTALSQNPNESNKLSDYNGFSDIEYNPTKSVNCQARSAAMYVSLCELNRLEEALLNTEFFLSLYTEVDKDLPTQMSFFGR